MKTQTAIIGGAIIACTVVLLTRQTCINPQNGDGRMANPSIRIVPAEQANPPVAAAATKLPERKSPYPVLVPTDGKESPVVTGSEVNRSDRETPNGNATRIQTIAIEPATPNLLAYLDDIGIPDMESCTIHPQLAWHEWIKPRVFLAKWIELWTNESKGTPVVLVYFTF